MKRHIFGIGSLVLMVIGLVIIHHQSEHKIDRHPKWQLWLCNIWVGVICFVAGWLFSSTWLETAEDTEWPKWPFLSSE